MIEVEHLEKRFGAVAAVDGLSMCARNGVITGLLGPNGAGKTTTIRMIGSLVSMDGGRVLINGIDVSKQPQDVRAQLGVLTDARGLYGRLTALENIRYYAELRGVDVGVSERSISQLAEWLDMRALLNRRVDGFSQGERMKVAIARALVHQPSHVVLDEPTNGLDVQTTRALRELIRRLKAEGRAVLFSSHIMQEVAALCDEIVIVARGKVAAVGSTADLLAISGQTNLEDAFVALAGLEETQAHEVST